MSTLRSAAIVLGSGVLIACTLTRSLDYLSNGVDGPGPGDASSGGSDVTSTSSGDSGPLPPAAGTVLAANQASPTNLAQDADSIYWTTDAKKVLKVPKAGGAVKELVAIPSAALGVAVDPSANGNVFVLLADGSLHTVPKAGGALAVFAGVAKGTSLAVDETSVFVTIEDEEIGDGTLVRFPKGGGAGVTISPPSESILGEIVLLGDKVFWSANNIDGAIVLNEQAKGATTTTPTKVYRNKALDQGAEYGIDPTGASQIAIDETTIYWIDEYINRPLRLDRTPGVGDAKAILETKLTPTGLAIDAKYIYITSPSDATSEIVRIPKAGGPPEKLAPQANPKQILADGNAIYVAFSGFGGTGAGGIQKIPTK